MKRIVAVLFVTYLFSNCGSALTNSKVHENFSDAEFQKVFHRSRREAVPDYEFVNVKTKHDHRLKRELRPLELETDGLNFQLHLRPQEHTVMSPYIPVWTAETQGEKKYSYKELSQEEKNIDGIIYEDPEKMASLFAYYKDRYIFYDGTFGESRDMKVVRSVPEKWWKHPTAEENEKNHFVYSAKQSGITVALDPEEDGGADGKLDKPLETWYPKLLVVVDYSLFEKLGKDIKETIRYVSTFWSSVNLRYSKVESPRIKIMVTGLIIGKDPTALEYVYKARNETNLEFLNAHDLLNRGRFYFRDNFVKATKFENYDSTMTMSSLDSGVVAGVAWVGQICGKELNVGYVGDDGSFSGILTATHELGHLLNLPHDGKNGCDGYISDDIATVMAPFVASVKEHIWSDCSKKTLQKFAWSKKAACMENHSRRREPED